jgi:hypothetical protein
VWKRGATAFVRSLSFKHKNTPVTWVGLTVLRRTGLHSSAWNALGERQPKIFRAPCLVAPESAGENGTASSMTAAASMEQGSAAILMANY